MLTHYHFCDERWYSQLGPTFKIVKEWQPDLFIVGLPLNMDDSESELSTRARKFARRLRHQTNIETWMVDERLTTREAREELGFIKNKVVPRSCQPIVLRFANSELVSQSCWFNAINKKHVSNMLFIEFKT